MSDAWIQTWSRKRFDLLEPRVEDVDFSDVVRSLCGMGRFTCHTDRPYTVAEHEMLAAIEGWLRAKRDMQPDEHARDVALCCLHHDDAEAYLGDLSSPWKLALGATVKPIIKAVERVVEEAILLPVLKLPKAVRVLGDLYVKPIDLSLLAFEADAFLPGGRRPDWAPIPQATPLLVNAVRVLDAMPQRRFAFYSLHEALVNGQPLPLWTGVLR